MGFSRPRWLPACWGSASRQPSTHDNGNSSDSTLQCGKGSCSSRPVRSGALYNPFYAALDKLLRKSGFDEFAEETCQEFYAARMGRPGLPPDVSPSFAWVRMSRLVTALAARQRVYFYKLNTHVVTCFHGDLVGTNRKKLATNRKTQRHPLSSFVVHASPNLAARRRCSAESTRCRRDHRSTRILANGSLEMRPDPAPPPLGT